MPLVPASLESDLNTLFDSLEKLEDPKASKKMFATQLSLIITKYIQSATVIVDAGQSVTTSGSPTTQTGSTTSPGTGSIE